METVEICIELVPRTEWAIGLMGEAAEQADWQWPARIYDWAVDWPFEEVRSDSHDPRGDARARRITNTSAGPTPANAVERVRSRGGLSACLQRDEETLLAGLSGAGTLASEPVGV